MLGLVVANNLLQFFIFWEIMGCSYLLIGFWFEKESAKKAAFKAFITTRAGDAIMFIGMMLLYVMSEPSSLRFSELFTAENLEHLSHISVTIPIFGSVPWIALIAVLIFWHRGQEFAVPAARLAARCDGRPHTRQRPDSCGDDGFRRCLPAGAHVPHLRIRW
ncbi:MAG: proton-conducting transporter membrane subunit [Caldilineaceae bacterium]